MKLNYKPKTNLEKFGEKIYNLLVENFSQTFYVGGMVRDILLGLKVIDVDIATKARPDQVILLLKQQGISYSDAHRKFGVIVAEHKGHKVEVATFRRDLPGINRYPDISFINSPKIDSQRRDFTINALYLSQKNRKILDFHNGLADLKARKLKFIGHPANRIKQDPLRIIRALRFALDLNLKLPDEALTSIKNNFSLVDSLTKSKITNELSKVKTLAHKKLIFKALDAKKLLDIK